MRAAIEAPASSQTRWFYVWAAAFSIVVTIVTFAPSYWIQLPAGTVVGLPGLHLHAVLFACWPLLFLLQSWFAATARIPRHRAWGVAGVSLATAMVYSGVSSALREMEHGLATGDAGAVEFALAPVLWIALFGGLVAVSLLNVRRPEVHKRLQVLAMISMMPAVVGHVFFSVLIGDGPGLRPGLADSPPAAAPAVFALIADLLIVGPMIVDWRTRGRPHAAYVIGAALMIVAHLSVVPLSQTDVWRAIATGMAGL